MRCSESWWGARAAWGPGKLVDRVFSGRPLTAFGINAHQWTTAAAQDEGEWRRTAERGVERFMAKWITAERAKAIIVYGSMQRSMPERDGKGQGEDSSKEAGSCWFTRHS